jgi:hypothetical protein
MSSYKPEQRRLTHRGRQFHFVSYEGQPATDTRTRQAPAIEPSWYMMSSGKRWQVMPHQPGQDALELDRLFAEWLETHVFCEAVGGPVAAGVSSLRA